MIYEMMICRLICIQQEFFERNNLVMFKMSKKCKYTSESTVADMLTYQC